MKNMIGRALLPLGIVVGSLMGSWALAEMKEPPEKKAQTKKALLVETVSVEKTSLNYSVNSQGTVLPRQKTSIVSEVNGKITALSPKFIEGGMFKKGDILVKVEPADYLTAVKSAEAVLAKAKATLEEERAKAKVAEEEWKSFMEGEAPELYLRKPQLAGELANVRYAEADLERAKRDLARTVIRAPYDGLVKEKSIDLGQFISRGTSLGTIYGTEIAEVRLPLSDADISYIDLPDFSSNKDEWLDVSLGATYRGKMFYWPAKIVRSEGVIDTESRVTYAVAQISDPYGRNADNDTPALRFGQFVAAEITGVWIENVAVLPRHTLKSGGNLLVIDDNKVRIQPVTVERADTQYVYVSGGINDGDQITITNIANPLNGMEVRVKGSEDLTPGDSASDDAVETASR